MTRQWKANVIFLFRTKYWVRIDANIHATGTKKKKNIHTEKSKRSQKEKNFDSFSAKWKNIVIISHATILTRSK